MEVDSKRAMGKYFLEPENVMENLLYFSKNFCRDQSNETLKPQEAAAVQSKRTIKKEQTLVVFFWKSFCKEMRVNIDLLDNFLLEKLL